MFVVACAAVAALAVLAPASASNLHERQDQVERQLEDAKGDLNQSTKDLDEATRSYEDAEAKLPDAEQALKAAERALADAEARLEQARGELAAAKAEDARAADRLATAEERVRAQKVKISEVTDAINEQRAAMSNIAVQAYQRGSLSELASAASVLRAESVQDLATRLSYAQSVLQAEDTVLTEHQANRARLANERVVLEELEEEARQLRAEAAAALERTKELEVAAQAAADEAADNEAKARAAKQAVDALVDQRSSARASAEKAKEADAAAYADLEAERQRIDAEIAEIARKERERQQDSSGGGSSSSGGGSSSGGSSSSSGLSYPVANPYVTSSYGMRTHPITGVYKLHDGTDFRAYCGTPIRASASGKVQWAYYRGGYGNQVMVDHGTVSGTHLMSSYSHLSRFAVSVGSTVSRGQVIGYSGTTGYSTACHLHFMVYANGGRTNPMNYL